MVLCCTVIVLVLLWGFHPCEGCKCGRVILATPTAHAVQLR